jgi:hypothetical protein
MPAQRKARSPKKPGKQPRKKHWLYDVEKALGLNHSDIARLLTPEHLSAAAIRDICHSHLDTPALSGLQFPVRHTAVSDIIAGESQQVSREAEIALWMRLGVRWNEYSQSGQILGFDQEPLSKDSLDRYLAETAEIEKQTLHSRIIRKLPANRRLPRFSGDPEDEFEYLDGAVIYGRSELAP